MSAEGLLELVQDFDVFIVVPLVLALVAGAATAFITGAKRSGLPGPRLGSLVFLSGCAVTFSVFVTYLSGAASVQALTCQPDSADFICTDAGKLTAILVVMFGTPLLCLSVLLLAWLPRREPFALRLLAATAALAAPMLPLWIVFSSPLFRVES